jgi:hypothetical protein
MRLNNFDPGLQVEERTIKERISDWVSCVFRGKEERSITILTELSDNFRMAEVG